MKRFLASVALAAAFAAGTAHRVHAFADQTTGEELMTADGEVGRSGGTLHRYDVSRPEHYADSGQAAYGPDAWRVRGG